MESEVDVDPGASACSEGRRAVKRRGRSGSFVGADFAPPVKRQSHSADGTTWSRAAKSKKPFDKSQRKFLCDYNTGHSWTEKMDSPDLPQTTSVEQAGPSNLLPEAQPVSSRKLAAKSVADQWKEVRACVDGEATLAITGYRLLDMSVL